MSCYSLKLFYALLLLLLHAAGSILGFNSLPNSAEIKCIESERQALLNFKHGLKDDSGMLSTWRDDGNNRDCCKWKDIQCNNQTGHVEMLHLRGQDTQYLRGAINISSLIALENIEHLDLSYNDFPRSHIPEHMGSFTNLRYLNLSYCAFVGSIPSDIGKLTHLLSQLELLKLSSCKLGPTFPSWLKTQSSLDELDISDNGINDSVPDWFWNKLQNMILLNMSHNYLIGSIPNISLKLPLRPSILLNSNQFEGKIPSFLLQASELMLSENNFSDLFSFLCDQSTASNLATLDLSRNQIKGQLPDCWKSVKQLLFLDLSSNKLEFVTSTSHMFFICTFRH